MSGDESDETPIDVGVLTFDWGREFREARRKGRFDADRKPIPDEGPLRVFLGHDTHGYEEEGHGAGSDVVRFIQFMLSAHKLLVWPRDGLTVYSTSPEDRAGIQQQLDALGEIGGVDIFDTLDDPIKSFYGYRPKPGLAKQKG